ncbi:CDP-diacylglycerol--serine O-phosphatidyltransferase [Bacilli bacterium]|nr:CDP-diacylglycerol--serine O-phosphatidyltransferase [Bacilli bacterium]
MQTGKSIGSKILKLLPSAITMLALCCGLSAIKFAILGEYVRAAHCIILSCLLDKVDGNVARKLNASSEFGAQMDSLADFFDFGIAPGFIVYLWKMHEYEDITQISWVTVLVLAICMAIRLARFNVSLVEDDPDSPLNKYFFRGIPAPMAAALVLLPMVLSFEYPDMNISTCAVITNTLLVSFMAGSTVPTPCFKKIKLKPAYEKISSMCIWIFIIGLIFNTWRAAIILCFLYIISIVISWFFYYDFYKTLNKKVK